MGKCLRVSSGLCTIFVAIVSIALLVNNIIELVKWSDRDWDCTADTPDAELANEGVYSCPDGSAYPPQSLFYVYIYVCIRVLRSLCMCVSCIARVLATVIYKRFHDPENACLRIFASEASLYVSIPFQEQYVV